MSSVQLFLDDPTELPVRQRFLNQQQQAERIPGYVLHICPLGLPFHHRLDNIAHDCPVIDVVRFPQYFNLAVRAEIRMACVFHTFLDQLPRKEGKKVQTARFQTKLDQGSQDRMPTSAVNHHLQHHSPSPFPVGRIIKRFRRRSYRYTAHFSPPLS
jgi:hypothetical protein